MQRIGLSLVITMTGLGLLLCAAPAQAQTWPQIWLSSDTGSDGNNCLSPGKACISLFGPNGALAKVSPGGIINVLPGTYTHGIINKAVSIIADHGQAVIAKLSTTQDGVSAAVVVNIRPSDVVRIRGLTIRPIQYSRGIASVAGGTLHLENCTLLNSPDRYGVFFRPTSASRLTVSNCAISENGGGGIRVQPVAPGKANVILDSVRLLNNHNGIQAFNRSNVMLRNSTISGNTVGVRAKGGNAVVRMADSTVTGNQTGLSALNNARIVSHRGNVVADNATNGSFTSTVNQQ
jgi:hypothetical protein